MSLLESTLALYLEAAPWLLFGLLAAGLLKAWVPERRMVGWLGGDGPWAVVKAALVGAPLPLCSCGVLPAALGLRRGGAGRGPTVSFLIATPETGADSIALSYALLGPFMAVARPVAAVVSAIFAGVLAGLVDRRKPEVAATPIPLVGIAVAEAPACTGSGCGCGGGEEERMSVARGVGYALSDILDDISLWLVLGLVAAGAVVTWVPPLALAELGSGLPAMLAMLAVGVPMYICATASTPLAAALLVAGISPGTVLVFLLAGPATNMATLAVVWRELGRGVLVAYLGGIAVAAVGLGLLVDLVVGAWGVDVAAAVGDGGDEWMPRWLEWGSAAVLTVCAVRPLRRRVVGG